MNSSLVDDLLLQSPIPPELWCPTVLQYKFTSSQALTACCVIANADQEVFVGFSPWDRGTTLLSAESGLDCTPQTLIGRLYILHHPKPFLHEHCYSVLSTMPRPTAATTQFCILADCCQHVTPPCNVRVQAVNIWYYCVVIEGHLLWHRPIKEYCLKTSCI